MNATQIRLQIALEAIRKIANLNCRCCETYVAKADGIAMDALVSIENINDVGVKDDIVPPAAT